ncbi:thermonuclease family protein [Desulfomonile tiedjei]|uniref:Micrococcal nuclease-like nuclease n=1 Tax=Desulfomonile tiedjei (strain ATCC 49306 / DSM 6799 / DCB-1) TaxID=706587 RepID=I4C3J1_DESTA|nr:thermonuclease family protein [Desulfomonile tiedjei]AFM24132.1 micrococcal nuclease-like nuclease [Desulfomonile tiedjei DSM 6799]
MKRLLLVVLLFGLMGMSDMAQPTEIWWGEFVRAIDGNLIVAKPIGYNLEETIRLSGIDAPEMGERLGREAQQFITEKLKGKQIAVDTQVGSPDFFGRILGVVYYLQPGKVTADAFKNLNAELLSAGLAYWDQMRSPMSYAYEEAQNNARLASKGIWGTLDRSDTRLSSAEEPGWYVIKDSGGNYDIMSFEQLPKVVSGPFESREAADNARLAASEDRNRLQAGAEPPQ